MTEADDYNDILGLEHFTVRLAEPNPRWAAIYQGEAQAVRNALGALLVDVQHIGSTSVPGIKAKPILDLLVGIKSFALAPECVAPLAALGYEYVPEAGIPNDYTFGKNDPRTHLAHVVEYGGPNWTENLRFRDALRHNPQLAREYEALKIALSERYANSRAEYTASKTDFIRRVIAEETKRAARQA